MNIIHAIVIELLYNGHLQSFGAAALVYVLTKSRGMIPDIYVIVATYLAFVFIFVYDRVIHVHRDRDTNAIRSTHILSYERSMKVVIRVALMLSLILFYFRSGYQTVLFMIGLIIAGYFYPHYCKDLTRYIPLFKNFYVSLVYPLLIFVPFNTLSTFHMYEVVLLCFQIFTDSFLAQMILDTKDIAVDKKHALKTFGALFGFQKTLIVVGVLSFVFACLYVLFGTLFHASISFYTITIGSLMIKFFIVALISRNHSSGYIISAGLLLLWYPLFELGMLFM